MTWLPVAYPVVFIGIKAQSRAQMKINARRPKKLAAFLSKSVVSTSHQRQQKMSQETREKICLALLSRPHSSARDAPLFR